MSEPEKPRAAVGRILLQLSVALLHVITQQLAGPLRGAEQVECRVDVVRQVAVCLAQVFNLRDLAVDAGLEDRVQNQVWIRIRRYGANFDSRAALVADRNANHGTAIDCRGLQLVRRFKVRVESAIGIDARVEQQADVVACSQDAVDKLPCERS